MIPKWQIGLALIIVAISGGALYYSLKTYNLTLTTSGSGSIHADQEGPFKNGAVVVLKAIPEAGWQFSGWQEAGTSSQVNPLQVTINGDKSVKATFTQIEYFVAANVSGGGSVNIEPSKPSYHFGDTVLVTAVPQDGWLFQSWIGSPEGDDTISLVVDGNETLTAVFLIKEYVVEASAGSGGGITPFGTIKVAHGSSHMFIITPNEGYHGYDVLVDGVSVGNVTEYVLNSIVGNHTIQAVFEKDVEVVIPTYSLTVSIAGEGVVTKNTTKTSFYLNEVVLLEATPEPGWAFSGWNGENESNLTLLVVITGDTQVEAEFTFIPVPVYYDLTKGVIGPGSVQPDKSGPYLRGTVVTLTAIPEAGASFVGWSGSAQSTLNPLSITMTSDKSIIATFQTIPTPKHILIYSDDLEAEPLLERPPVVAADILGYQYTACGDYGEFLTELDGGSWDLVIFNEELYHATVGVYDALNSHVLDGGKLIVAGWGMSFETSHSLWATMGVEYESKLIFSPDTTVYVWDDSSPLFNQPVNMPDSFMLYDYEQFGIDGVHVSAVNGASIVLGDTTLPTGANGLIAVSADGSTIFNGVNTGNYSLDENNNGEIDSIDIWVNEIAFLLG